MFNENDIGLLREKIATANVKIVNPLHSKSLIYYQLATFIEPDKSKFKQAWKNYSLSLGKHWDFIVHQFENMYLKESCRQDCFIGLWYDSYVEAQNLKVNTKQYKHYLRTHMISSDYLLHETQNIEHIVLIRMIRNSL